MAADSDNYQGLAKNLGIAIDNCKVSLICQNQNSQSISLPANQPVPPDWLPGGSQEQCDYFLQTQVNVEISPWFCSEPAIPGMTAPLPVTFTTSVPWENLGCDPATQQFYLNE